MSKQTPSGGWTKEALACWGVTWPPPKGWMKAILAGHEEFYAQANIPISKAFELSMAKHGPKAPKGTP